MKEAQAGATAIGSGTDMIARMRAVIPNTWFPAAATDTATNTAPILDGLLAGISCAWAYCYALAAYVRQQARLETASGSFLDMICIDYFDRSIKRKSSETDDVFRKRILANLLLPRATRQAVIAALNSLLNYPPNVFEPSRAADTGGYGGASLTDAGGGGGYNTPSVFLGSTNMPYQFLITVANSFGRNFRESQATFIDINGTMQIAGRHLLRPSYSAGIASGLLLESRSFNLLKDSVGWTGLSPSAPDANIRWSVDPEGTDGIWSGHPTLQITVYSGDIVFGPTMTAMTAGGPVTASIWLLIPADHRLQSLALVLGSPTDRANAAQNLADLTVVGAWQRVNVTFAPVSGEGGKVFMQLSGVSESLMNTPVITQCWQIEPGSSVSSYIPSGGQIGIREADNPSDITRENIGSSSVDVQDLAEAITRLIPVGSVAWTAVLD